MVGTLDLWWRVQCAKCFKVWAPGPALIKRREARTNLREVGWVFVRRCGWICPRCQGEAGGEHR